MSADCTRPALPVVAWFALAVWVGAVFGEGAGPAVTAATVVAACVVAGVAARLHTGRGLIVVMTAGMVAGAVVSAVQGVQLQGQMRTALESGSRAWCGTVEADPMSGTFGASVRVGITGGPLDGARVRVGWPEGEHVPELGQQVRFSAVLKPVPMAEEWGRRAARAGVCASGNAWKATATGWKRGVIGQLYRWRSDALARIHELSGPGADLAEGIVLGDRRRLIGSSTEQDFQILGLTHLVAVSGSHLALACGAVAFLGSLIKLPRRPLVLATLAAGAAYAIVTGLPYSALRSLLMLAVGGVAQLIGRRGQGIASLSVAVVAVVVIEPWSVFDIGLQLSVLAVAALLVFGALSTAWVAAAFPMRLRGLVEPLSLTLAAQVATVPVVASAFGLFSVLAPLANAVAGPLVSVALLLGLGGAVLGTVLPGLGEFAMKMTVAVLGATSWLASGLASLPGAAIAFDAGCAVSAGVLVVAVLLWLRWPLPGSVSSARRFVSLVVCGSLALSLGPAPPQHATVTVLDVGQGDAILVQDGGRAMLVDAGPDPATLRRALSETGIRRLDVVVLTHAHDDHTGGMPALDAVTEIGWIGIPELEAEGPPGQGFRIPETLPCDVRGLEAGACWDLGRTHVSVLWPDGEDRDELDTNDTSVVLLVDAGEFEMVLTGDAEGHVQERLLAAGALTEIEVLKVPHHGSTNGLIADALSAWSPQLACISVGAGNDFGHPNGETLAMLQHSGVRVMRTDECGSLTIEVNDRGYRVRGDEAAADGAQSHGEAARLHERMCHAGNGESRLVLVHPEKDACGSQGRCAETCLSHLRRRGAAARARPPPPARPHSRGC